MHAGTFAAIFAALYVAHQLGDHWIQTSAQAARKGAAGWPGRLACARHVATYTAAGLAAVLIVAWQAGLHLDPVQLTAGLAVSAVTHYIADRRAPLLKLAQLLERSTGKATFYRLGAPRDGHNDNPSLGTGAYALDQSWHVGWLFVAALVIA
jgi:hypothetical protein